MSKRYDVFLSHSSIDKPAVEHLAQKLRDAGITPFLDRWQLIPGRLWQPQLAAGLRESSACAIFVGAEGFGPWQEQEMQVALDRGARDQAFAIIPVLLPGFRKPADPGFLAQRVWVEFPSLEDGDAFRSLLSGIRGNAPGPGTAEALSPSSRVWPGRARLWGAVGISVLLMLVLVRLPIPDRPGTPKFLPNDPRAREQYLKGLQSLSRFDSSEARRVFEDVLKIEDFPPARSALAEAYVRLGENNKALQQARTSFESSGALPPEERLEIEARYRRISGEWDAATDLYLKLRKNFPNSSRNLEYNVGLAESLIYRGKGTEALQELDRMKAASRDPDPLVFLWEAWAASSEHNLQRQSRAASEVVKKTEGTEGYRQLEAKALLFRGDALITLDNPGAALPDLMKAQQYYGEVYDQRGEAQAWHIMAWIRFSQGQIEESKKDHRNALENYEAVSDDQGVANQHFSLAHILFETGSLEEAQREYELALEGYDDDIKKAHMQLSLAEVQLEKGHPIQAESRIQEALATFQGQGIQDQVAESQALLARVFLRQGQRVRARSAVETARRLADKCQPTICAEVALAEAQVHEAFGERREALAILDRALKEAEQAGLSDLGFELRLALGEIDGNRERLEEVERQARPKGFLLIADKAKKWLLAKPGATPGPPSS